MEFKKLIFFIFLFFVVLRFGAPAEAGVAERAGGYIVLQAEQKGEAWYVDPAGRTRYFLGRPDDAWRVMRELGVGITDADLARIPLSFQPDQGDDFARRQSGRIFLQVEQNGEAWYVYPRDRKRYFLGRPSDALELMRNLGLGITDADLALIPAGSPDYDSASLEMAIHRLVNLEREAAGLTPLAWNGEVAASARGHSFDLARANKAFTGPGRSCDYPLIHHEALSGGLYHSDRLKNSNIHYSSRSGENIALVSASSYSVYYRSQETAAALEIKECDSKRRRLEEDFLARLEKAEKDEDKIAVLRQELSARQAEYSSALAVETGSMRWLPQSEIAAETVRGWMESPGHRANILGPEYNEAGIGIAHAGTYAISTQVFIKRAECGYLDGRCCQENNYTYCFMPNSCSQGFCR